MEYPKEVIKIMQPQMADILYAIRAHYKKRHINGCKNVTNWIKYYRKVDQASGYSIAIKRINHA